MRRNVRIRNIAAGICMAAVAGTVHADETAQNLEFPSAASLYTRNSPFIDSRSYMLALNEDDAAKKQAAMPVAPAAEFKPPLFSGSNVHKHLGLATLAMVVATVIAPKPPEIEDRAPTQAELDAQDSSTHAKLGRATAALAAATVTTGLLAHWDDFHLEDGLYDPDNLHALLGTAGSLAMLYAVSKAPGGGHAGMGMAGGVAMGVAIKITW